MNFLHKIIERAVIFSFSLCFSFVALYTPQPVISIIEVPYAEAGVSACLTATGPCSGMFETIPTMIAATKSIVLDEVLDGLVWQVSKQIINEMTASVVKWVNSGFKGSPAFITDFKGYMTEVSDRAFGEALQDLGGVYSFVCDPFKLDVQVAVAKTYEKYRENDKSVPPATCTLTGALENIEGFIDSTKAFTDPASGGWDTWLKVATNPNQYTPFGNLSAAQQEALNKIAKAEEAEKKTLDYGQGFMSSKRCQKVTTPTGDKEECTITTPGKVINESLNKQLGASVDSLVTADEFNEIISAIVSQFSTKAVTGSNGLLGLSGGTGYTYSGVPLTDQVQAPSDNVDSTKIRDRITDALALENDFLVRANLARLQFKPVFDNPYDWDGDVADAIEAYERIVANHIPQTTNSIINLEALLVEFDADPDNSAVINSVTEGYFAIYTDLHSAQQIDQYQSQVDAINVYPSNNP